MAGLESKGLLYVVDPASGKVIREVALNGNPMGAAWLDDDLICVAEYGAASVAVVDVQAGSVVGRLPVGPKSVGVATVPDKNLVIVCDNGLHQVAIINASDGQPLARLRVAAYPFFVAASTDGRVAVVGHLTPSGPGKRRPLVCGTAREDS